ncbi:hypothetical protein H4R34_001002 [Dimargaris verticillata]|uniref:Uncharacterized protein n=1 Tax=Dimargaris verticillata TaxID=2761393 RepID=A0A9W8B5K0_9FUNG|nr:hypothetical protein H4R34_001002 [Dimargaris verticillata]
MVRISIWLLATVAAVSLTSAVPMDGGNGVFPDLRRHLKLQPASGRVTLIGLQTLLEGAWLELRGVSRLFSLYLNADIDLHDNYQRQHPDLFQKYKFRKENVEALIGPWIKIEYTTVETQPNLIKDFLLDLGQNPSVNYIVNVIKALFAMLSSNYLLTDFRTILKQKLDQRESNRGVDLTNLAAIKTLPVESEIILCSWIYFG